MSNDDFNSREKDENEAAPIEDAIVVDIPGASPEAIVRIESTVNAIKSLQDAINNSPLESLRSLIPDYSSMVASVFPEAISVSLFPAIEQIKRAVASIHIPEISEEKKQKLQDSHELWGSYGWTLIPIAGDGLFDRPPKDRAEAGRVARHACKNTKDLFSYIRKQKRVKTAEFDEAVCDFSDKRYKSCALLLFSLIDGHLIRFQRGTEANGKSRKVGKGAVDLARQRVHADNPKRSLFGALFYINLFTCLDKVFENTTDFKKETSVINRNYLDHGMLTRKVTRTDCLQLFLLYCNVLDMLDLTYLTGD